MATKAERTTAFIIETVAPVFNKHGYIGTSMSDLTEATGLTKGALYGNFKNKEALALAAFEYNSKQLLDKIDEVLSIDSTALDKIFNLTNFYKNYNVFTTKMGGCPIIKVGVDAQYNNLLLNNAVKATIKSVESKIASILENGIKKGELSLPVPALQFAKQFFTMLQGAVVMYTTTQDHKYLNNTVAYLKQLVAKEIKK